MESGYTILQPPHGHVRYIEHLGSDISILRAARISYGSPSKGEEADKKLLDYLFRNRHTSPFEQCSITFNIKFPIFLMRQFVRHRTFRLNEVSARYTELPEEFFLPKSWRVQDTKNKQGSLSSSVSKEWQDDCTKIIQETYRDTYFTYETLLERGVAKEQARMILPVGIYTEIFVNADLHNLMHFLRLREDLHAQEEIRDLVVGMKEIFQELFPWTYELYEKYELKMVNKLDNL